MISLVDVYVTMDDVRRGKPAPDILLLAARRLGLRPSSIIVVGDSVYDVAAGKAAGMRTAGVVSGASSLDQLKAGHPDFLLRSITQVLSLIDELPHT
jgi:beta-phosphoglucomutase-like phosphatase (HAD superfamily)